MTPSLTTPLLLLACSGSTEPAAPPPARVQAVTAKQTARPAEAPDAWCDRYAGPEEAASFSWPPLDGEPPAPTGGWTWVNAWATWCKPCIEEMPRLVEWEPKLQAAAGSGGVRFLSMDATARAVADFHAANPSLPMGVRITGQEVMDPWVSALGIEPAAAALPIHLFLDDRDRVRCLFMGRIEPSDYATVEGMLKAL